RPGRRQLRTVRSAMGASGRRLLLVAAAGVVLALATLPEARAAVASGDSLDKLTPADALIRLWTGVRDSSEQVAVSPDRTPFAAEDDEPVRVRTVVSRVNLPWLGARVLYLEEFLHDQPGVLRRQLLLRVETETVGARRARVLPYRFKDGEPWQRL